MGTFHVENFGCRAARADGEAIAARLQHCMQRSPDADVVIVNTCSVTAEADREARAYIRRTHRANPAARIVVAGCYAQRAPEELAGLPGVAAVVGNSHKAWAAEIAAQIAGDSNPERNALIPVGAVLGNGGAPVWADDSFAHSLLEEGQVVPGGMTRPNLKIQEGCGNRCTFCVIPTTRGPSRSMAAESVLRQVRGFVEAGGNELVLSGINLGRWGRDFARPGRGNLALPQKALQNEAPRFENEAPASLAGIVRRILVETELPRLRLSSIEPMDWNEELIGLMADFGGGRLARHAHLPLQSGSDAVLRRMHRRYRPWHYVEKVQALFRAAGPELTLGADVMVGFPGETDAEFAETLEVVRRLPFGYLHLFPFSPRPGTALHAAEPLAAGVLRERMAALRGLAAEKMRAHREQFVGAELEAITLHTDAELAGRGRTRALSENFIPMEIAGRAEANRLVRIRVTAMDAAMTLTGEIA